MEFYEVSAKSGLKVDDAFVGLARMVKERVMADGGSGPTGGKVSLKAGAAGPSKKSCC